MAEQFQNFFVTKLREACDATATTIYVETVPSITEGTLVLEYANSTKHEIIHFTGVSGYGLTGCTRGLEGTTAQSHSAGTDVRQNLTAGMIDKLINGVITTENIADGAVTADKIDFTTLPSIKLVGGGTGWQNLPTTRGDLLQRVTINEAGKYLILGRCFVEVINYASYISICKNNVILANSSEAVGGQHTLNVFAVEQFNANDTVYLQGKTDGSGRYYDSLDRLEFAVIRIG